MIDYIDYLVSKDKSYRRNLTITICLATILGTMLGMIALNPPEYFKEKGKVESITMGFCKRKRTAPLNNSNGYKNVESVVIQLNNKKFYIDHNLKNKWNVTLQQIGKGDIVYLEYNVIDDYNIIGSLRTKKKTFIKINERSDSVYPIKLIIAVLFVLLSVLALLFFLRRRKFNIEFQGGG